MLIFTLLFLAASFTAAQTPLHQRLADIANAAQGKVYVSCSLPGIKLDCEPGRASGGMWRRRSKAYLR
jgi:beta-lactamase class A